MHQLKTQDTTLSFPSNWNELTAVQLLFFCRLVKKESNMNKLYFRLLLNFTGLKIFQKPSEEIDQEACYLLGTDKQNKWYIPVTHLVYFAQPLTFMFAEMFDKEGVSKGFRVDCRMTTNVLPKINTLCGPANGLTNLVFDEFIEAETNYFSYQNTQNEAFLNKFIAVLYRPEKSSKEQSSLTYNGDVRVSFNSALTEKYAAITAKFSSAHKQAICYWYEGCKHFIMQTYPRVFKTGGESSPIDMYRGYQKMINASVEGDPTKKDQVRTAMLFDVLETFEENAKRVEEITEKTT